MDRDGFFRLGAEETFDWSHQPRLYTRDGIQVTPDGTLWRVALGRTLRSFDGDGWTRYRQKRIFWGLDAESDGTVWATWVDTCGADPEGCVPNRIERLDHRGWMVFEVPRMYAYSGNQLAVTPRAKHGSAASGTQAGTMLRDCCA